MWKLVSDSPPIAEDVLVYSSLHKGYGVGRLETNRQWINSTVGIPFVPHTVTHWMPLPDPPVEKKPEFRSLKAVQ